MSAIVALCNCLDPHVHYGCNNYCNHVDAGKTTFYRVLPPNYSHVIYSMKNTENERRPLGGNRMTFAYHPASTWEKART